MMTGVLAAAGGVIVALLVWRLAAAGDEAASRPRAAPDDVEGLLQEGRKIAAVKAYRARHPGMGLKEAKEAVDRLERGDLPPQPPPAGFPPRDAEVEQLIRDGRLVEAIRLYRERHPQLGLAEAKAAVEVIARLLVLAAVVLSAPPSAQEPTSCPAAPAPRLAVAAESLTLRASGPDISPAHHLRPPPEPTALQSRPPCVWPKSPSA